MQVGRFDGIPIRQPAPLQPVLVFEVDCVVEYEADWEEYPVEYELEYTVEYEEEYRVEYDVVYIEDEDPFPVPEEYDPGVMWTT